MVSLETVIQEFVKFAQIPIAKLVILQVVAFAWTLIT
jgi:hypothetical protein